jgi:hypothetical protein
MFYLYPAKRVYAELEKEFCFVAAVVQLTMMRGAQRDSKAVRALQAHAVLTRTQQMVCFDAAFRAANQTRQSVKES